MMQINVVSRISDDKNFFLDLLFAAKKLTDMGRKDFRLLFIGDVQSLSVYKDMVRLAALFDLNGQVSFTRKSIRLTELPDEARNGYFFNFTIGNFMGYSGVESLDNGFKTIFYNIDEEVSRQTDRSVSFCADLADLEELLTAVYDDPTSLALRIATDNSLIKQRFDLSTADETLLEQILCGGTS